MKKVIGLFILLVSLSFISAACNLDVSLINQDPYPAIQGDYVKLVFQVDGIAEDDCGTVSIELLEDYPLVFDPDMNPITSVNAGFYAKDFGDYLVAPYKVRVDEEAVDGANPIEVKVTSAINEAGFLHQFDLEVEDARADFEIHIKDYDYSTNILTLEILNIAEADVEAVTLEIPNQENIVVKGPSINIVGDVDSNEYTTADFEAIPNDGEIKVRVLYSDSSNTRRVVEKTVVFDSSYFIGRVADQRQTSPWTIVLIVLIIGGVVYYFYRRRQKKKEAERHRRH